MNCPNCGVDNREGARFCRGCGTELKDALPAKASSTVERAEGIQEVQAQEVPDDGSTAGAEIGLPEEMAEEALVEWPDAVAEESQETDESPEVLAETPEAETTADLDADLLAEASVVPESREALPMPETEPEAETELAGMDQAESDAYDTDGELRTSGEPIGLEEEGETPPLPWDQEDEQDLSLPELDDSTLSFWRQDDEPLTPFVPGTVVAGRYLVVEALDVQEDEILYHVRDLKRCWQCDFDGNSPDEAFCTQCGAALDRKVDARLWEVRDEESEPASGERVAERLVHDGRFLVVPAPPEPKPEDTEADKRLGIRLLLGRRSDPGQLRDLNEDSILTLVLVPSYETSLGSVQGLFAVADGMGGHEGGEIASKLALQVLAKQVIQTIILPELGGELVREEDIVAHLHRATMAANDAVYLDRKKRESDMGTTLTSVFVRDDRLFFAHVGDSRVYRWNADGLEQLTVDHSVVASMIADGQAEPEEIYTHPHRSIIYRSIGDKPVVEVDADMLPLTIGDRIIICSDGLWEMIRDEGITDVMMQEADPQLACDMLVRHANAAGGDDNISAIVVRIEEI